MCQTYRMRWPVKIVLAVVLVILAGLITWQLQREREPVYEGKPLTAWLEQYGTNHWSNRKAGELEAIS